MTECSHCAELEEEVAWLRSELGLQQSADVKRRLYSAMTGGRNKDGRLQACDLVAALYSANGRPMTRMQIMEAVPSPSGNERDRDMKIVDVWVSVAKKSLGPDTIQALRGTGYYLTASGSARVAEILA